MVKSSINGRLYDPDNANCIYIGNMKQIAAYLSAEENLWDDLLDIIVSEKKKSKELAFVFKRDSERLKELYSLWNSHQLT